MIVMVRPVTTDEVIQFFEDVRRRPLPRWHIAVWTYFALAGPLLLGAICLSPYVDGPLTGWTPSPWAILFSLCNIYYAVMFAFNLYATRYAPGRLARMMREGKNDIAWLYIETLTTYHEPDTSCGTLHFHFTDRRSGRVNEPLEIVTRLMNFFDARYADVSLGYEPKLARRFFFRPKSLKTRPVRHRMVKKTVHSNVSADNVDI